MIIFFSGTGNTRFCAESLGKLLGDIIVELSASDLLDPDGAVFETSDRRMIWMFPTYSWGIPPVVFEVIRRASVKTAEGCEHWMVTTCGDDVGRIAGQWRSVMRSRGFVSAAAFSVRMPNTYTFMKGYNVDSAELEKEKLSASGSRIRFIADRIGRGMPCDDDVVEGAWAWAKTAIVRPWFNRFCMSPKPFHHTDACTRCGLCMRSCPMENITSSLDGHPQWGKNCALCERCYHICPSHAVAYGNETEKKGQYTHFLR